MTSWTERGWIGGARTLGAGPRPLANKGPHNFPLPSAMEEALVPSLSSGSVGSRFVSQTDLDKAKATRDEQWKAAYAR